MDGEDAATVRVATADDDRAGDAAIAQVEKEEDGEEGGREDGFNDLSIDDDIPEDVDAAVVAESAAKLANIALVNDDGEDSKDDEAGDSPTPGTPTSSATASAMSRHRSPERVRSRAGSDAAKEDNGSNAGEREGESRTPFYLRDSKGKAIYERWTAETQSTSAARSISAVLFLYAENIASFRSKPLRTNKILRVLEAGRTNLLSVEADAFAVAQNAPTYDLSPDLPYNGFRSLLKAFQASLIKIHEALVECKSSRDSLFFDADGVYSALEDYGVAMMQAWRVLFAAATRLDRELLKGKAYFVVSTKSKVAQEILRVSRFADVTSFYGKRAAFHLPDAIAVTMRMILVAMCGYKHQFANPRKQNLLMRSISSAIVAVKYAINPEDHTHTLVQQLRTRSIPFVKSFWNLTESTFARNMPKVTGPLLDVNNVAYIKGKAILHNGPHGQITIIPDLISDAVYKLKKEARKRASKDATSGTTADSMQVRLSSIFSSLMYSFTSKLESCATKDELHTLALSVKKEVDEYHAKGSLTAMEHHTLTKTLYNVHKATSRHIKMLQLQSAPGDIDVLEGAKSAAKANSRASKADTTQSSSSTKPSDVASDGSEAQGHRPGDSEGSANAELIATVRTLEQEEHLRSMSTSSSVFSALTTPTTAAPSSESHQLFSPDTPTDKLPPSTDETTYELQVDVDADGSSRFGSIRTRLLSFKKRVGQVPGKVRGCLPASDWLIFHIHGGGFIAQSSLSHEVYLRSWAKEFNYPIFSIDYSLAPEHPYPRPAQECYFAYVWALEHAAELGWTGKHVLVVGDSAGGNLSVSVALRCIAEGVRLPTAVVPIYPALNTDLHLSASRIISCFDVLLNQSVLETCLCAYSNATMETLDQLEITDMFMSPILAKPEFLAQLPFTHVVALSYDPLLDDSLAFVKKLRDVGVPHKLTVLDSVPHGFLNFKDVARESLAAYQVIVRILHSVFNRQT